MGSGTQVIAVREKPTHETRAHATPVDGGRYDVPDGAEARRRHRPVPVWTVIVSVVALLAVAGTVWVVSFRRGDIPDEAFPGSSGVATDSATPTVTASPTPSATTEPATSDSAAPHTASAALDDFLTRATMADKALREASDRINAAITTTEVTYDQHTRDLLASAAPGPVASTLPAGMPDTLKKAALLVYSDLVSRWAAMSGSCDHGEGTLPRAEFDGCFVQGAPAAARFAGDLSALDQLAEATPEFAVAAQDSRTAEALAVRIRYIDLGNLGCANMGGYVATDPIPIVWQRTPDDAGGADWQGTVGAGLAGIPFRGTFDPVLGWQIEILAC